MQEPTIHEYTFAMGDVNAEQGIYFSWVVEAENEDHAVQKSREQFEDYASADRPFDVLESGPQDCLSTFAMIFKINPDYITKANIIAVY